MAHEILIVDDEPDIRMLIDGILADEGYETRAAGEAEEAIAAFRARRPALVVLDVWLQGSRLDGIELLEMFRGEEPRVPVVMISGHGTIEMAVGAIQQGAYDFIEKPFQSDRLLLVVRRALEAAALARENAELRLRAGPDAGLIGESSLMGQIRNLVEKVAPTGSRVLITGPAGSGKEVVARMVHANSRRADGPFIVVDSYVEVMENQEDSNEMEYGITTQLEFGIRKNGDVQTSYYLYEYGTMAEWNVKEAFKSCKRIVASYIETCNRDFSWDGKTEVKG